MSTSNPTNQLQITNSTTVDFAVVDSVSKSPDASASQQLAQVLKLLKTTTGADNIAAGKKATVILDDTYVDPQTGKTEPSLLYRLIFSTSNWLVPICVKGVMQNLITKNYAPVTVAESDRQAMVSAIQFVAMIATYPTSSLAKGFNAAVSASTNNASMAQSPDAVTQGVTTFFKGTKEYQNVTLDMVVEVNSYYNTFPFVWARYQDTMTYYLYSSDGTNPTKSEGKLTMTRAAGSGMPNVTDSNGGYQIVYTDANGATQKLSYVNGQFVDDANADIPTICLQGTFTLKSRLTGKASDNQIMSSLTGSINSTTVLGLDTQQSTDSNGRSFWQTLFEPQGAQQIINSIMTIGGLLMMAHFAYTFLKGIAQWVRQKWTGKKPPNLEDLIKQQAKDFEAALKQSKAELLKKLTADRQRPPADDAELEPELENSASDLEAWSEKSSLDAAVDVEAQRLQNLAEAMPDGPTPALEEAASNLQGIADDLSSAAPSNISDVTQGKAAQLDGVRQTINTEQANVEQELSQDVQQSLAEQRVQSDAIAEDLTKVGEDRASVEDGSVPEGEDVPKFEMPPLEI